MPLADMKDQLVDTNAEIKILARRCEGDAPAEADISELAALIDKREALNAKIDEKERQNDVLRAARSIAEEPVQSNAPPAAPVAGTPGDGAATVVGSIQDRAELDPMRGFQSSQEYFRAVIRAEQGHTDGRLAPLATIGSDEQRGNSNPDGGFLIPEGMSPNLLSTQYEGDPSVGLVTNIPMESPVIRLNARVDKNHSTSVSGGFKFYRRQETAGIQDSKTKFDQIKLDAVSLAGASFATDELLADSPISVAAIISQGFNEEYGSHMFSEKLRGTGVGEAEGILNNPALVTVAKEGSQAAATIVGNNIVKMRARAWGYNRGIWMANPDTYPELCKAHLSGTNGDVFLFQPGRGIDVPDTLLGRPIVFDEHLSTLGTVGDLVFADWSQYLFGNYQPLESASSMHVRFLNNEQTFKVTTRNDGRCWWRTALTPKKGSNTHSPFVALATRA